MITHLFNHYLRIILEVVLDIKYAPHTKSSVTLYSILQQGLNYFFSIAKEAVVAYSDSFPQFVTKL